MADSLDDVIDGINVLDEDQIASAFFQLVSNYGVAEKFSRETGVDRSTISQAKHGVKKIPYSIIRAMGYRRKIIYIKER